MPPLIAVTVTVSPLFAPDDPIVGVVSLVMLSVDEVPVSEALARFGADGAVIAATVTVRVDEVLRLRMSWAAYRTAVAVPVNPPIGVNVTSPVKASTAHVPSPLTTNVDSEQTGGVSFGPQRVSELGERFVPLSLESGEKVMLSPAVPVALSVIAVGNAGV